MPGKKAFCLAGLILTIAVSARAQYAELSPQRIHQIEAMMPAAPAGFVRPCSDRSAWQPLAAQLAPQVKRAEALLTQPLPAWSDDAYLNFKRTGDRLAGEKMMHARQDWLPTLVLAECAEGRGRYISRIAMVLDELASQKSWTLPAHDGNLDSFSGRHYFVELNSADLAHTIAETLYLLGPQLREETRRHMMDALEQRIFAPMRESFSTGKGNAWIHYKMNWNAVCLDGVTGAALTVLPDRKDRALFAAAGEHYSQYYLDGFQSDGYGVEGMGYWNYGFSHFVKLRETLWQATQGKIDLFASAKAKKIALFGTQFPMFPDNVASFEDAHYMLGPDAGLMQYVERVFGLKASTPNSGPGQIEATGLKTLTWVVMTLFPNHAAELKNSIPGGDAVGLRTYYPESQVLVSRPNPDGKLAITIKGGGNTTHSHNDIGSFVIGLGATQPVGDPGGPSYYTASTFSKDRLQSRLLNSYGHPVPVIDGHLQLDATKVIAQIVDTKFTDKQDSITINATNAYDTPRLRKYLRTMRYSREGAGSIEIEDRFDLTGPVDIEESLPTHGSWRQIDDKTLEFTADGERLRVMINAPGTLTLSADKVDDYRNPFTRVGAKVHLEHSGSVKMVFTPE
jgi:hypothetical protein